MVTDQRARLPVAAIGGGLDMAKKRDNKWNDPKLKNENGLSRRDFVKTGAAAGLGAAALLESDKAQA